MRVCSNLGVGVLHVVGKGVVKHLDHAVSQLEHAFRGWML